MPSKVNHKLQNTRPRLRDIKCLLVNKCLHVETKEEYFMYRGNKRAAHNYSISRNKQPLECSDCRLSTKCDVFIVFPTLWKEF